MMSFGTSCTPIPISAKPHYPPLVVAGSFKEAALPSPSWLRHEQRNEKS
jgi:hypothetical protein